VMRGCRSLSNSAPVVDGLDDLLRGDKQVMFDLAFSRERRQEQQGYVTAAQARAFLRMSRQFRPGSDTPARGNPLAQAYFRAIEWTTPAEVTSGSRRLPATSGEPAAPEDSAAAAAAVGDVLDLLVGAGILAPPPRALLDGPKGGGTRLARIQAQMRFAGEHDQAAFSMRSQELAYLANTIVAGCSIQARAFTAQEASDAAVAVCNLGLENWSVRTAQPDDFLVGHDLVSVFQVGWKVLYQDVCMYAAGRLIGILRLLRCDDRETHSALKALRIEMTKHRRAGEPWLAREGLDVIAILDMPAWAALLGLIDECPVLHAGISATRSSGALAVSASAFEFISENSQIASVRAFMESLRGRRVRTERPRALDDGSCHVGGHNRLRLVA
jgi:hypothetical protein